MIATAGQKQMQCSAPSVHKPQKGHASPTGAIGTWHKAFHLLCLMISIGLKIICAQLGRVSNVPVQCSFQICCENHFEVLLNVVNIPQSIGVPTAKDAVVGDIYNSVVCSWPIGVASNVGLFFRMQFRSSATVT